MDPMCLTYGVVISLVVSFLKRWPIAANNPKIVSALLSSALAAWTLFGHGGAAMTTGTVQTLVGCILTQYAASVATHETVVQPIKDAVVSRLFSGTKS